MPFGLEQQSIKYDTVCDLKVEELSDIKIERQWTEKVEFVQNHISRPKIQL